MVSKVLERIVSKQLDIQNDLLQATSHEHGCVVLLLDLSAAFDTIDHEILLDRLSAHCGIRRKPLAWIASYFTNRTQSVVIDGVAFEPVEVKYGVP